MFKPAPIRQRDVEAVRRALSKGAANATELLQSLVGRPVRSAAALREWHDALLFVLAHPPSESVATVAQHELHRVAQIARGVAAEPDASELALINSGIEGTTIEGVFSLTLVRWLSDRWPGAVQLAAIDAPIEEVRELLRGLLLPIEWESVDLLGDDNDELCRAVLGEASLATLVRLLEQAPVSEHVRTLWFARLQVRVSVSGAATGCSTTQARAPRDALFVLDTPFVRAVDVRAVVAQPLNAPVSLRPRERSALISTARTVLATLERETDPVTYTGHVSLHDMGRGLRIALYSLAPPQRLPFDSYVGFMAFRNGVPLAYGGTWIFPGRSKIGINVFEAQRGGESAWFFAQLLRLYAQTFAVSRFEVENYQLGYGNADGLRSGAYWFYYRLGFRPVAPSLQIIAEREFRKLSSESGYPVPLPLLRSLVAEGLELDLRVPESAVITPEPLDTAALTLAVQTYIVQQYDGDRRTALQRALTRLRATLPLGDTRTWSADERTALEMWALPIDMIRDLEQWTTSERQALVRVVRSKGATTETQHQRLLAAHTRVLDAWRRYCDDLR